MKQVCPALGTHFLIEQKGVSSLRLARATLILPSRSTGETSKVTSYYLLPRLIVANQIPSVLVEQVGHLLPNEVLFSHRQTKTKQQREAVHKRAVVRWVTCCLLSRRSIKTIQPPLYNRQAA